MRRTPRFLVTARLGIALSGIALSGVALLGAGCGGGSDLEGDDPDIAALTAAPVTSLDTAPSGPVDLTGYDAVWFATPWCRRCDQQLAEVVDLYEADCDRSLAVVLGRAGEGAIGQFVGDRTSACPDPLPVFVDTTGASFGAVPVIAAPIWVTFTGTTPTVHRKALEPDDLRRLIDQPD